MLKNFLCLVKIQFDAFVKILRSDNGTEFFNSDCEQLLASYGIVHQSGWPYYPQHNDTFERKHRHILEVARALKFRSGLPITFGGDCVRTSVYLINKLTSQMLKGQTPDALLYGKAPNLDHFRVFDFLCYASKLPRPDKFAARARVVILVGYSKIKNGYKLYDLTNKTFFVNRFVCFRESEFPFHKDISIEMDMFNIDSFDTMHDSNPSYL